MYTAAGTINGKGYSVIWQDGTLSGSQEAIERLEIEAQALKKAGVPVGPEGMYLAPDLAEPLAALFIMRQVFGADLKVTGEVPEPPDEEIPEGAKI